MFIMYCSLNVMKKLLYTDEHLLRSKRNNPPTEDCLSIDLSVSVALSRLVERL